MSAALQSLANIGISISESPDIAVLRLHGRAPQGRDGRPRHLPAVLRRGAGVYGGDLRDRGFTRLIFDLVLRYRPREEAVANYLA